MPIINSIMFEGHVRIIYLRPIWPDEWKISTKLTVNRQIQARHSNQSEFIDGLSIVIHTVCLVQQLTNLIYYTLSNVHIISLTCLAQSFTFTLIYTPYNVTKNTSKLCIIHQTICILSSFKQRAHFASKELTTKKTDITHTSTHV